MRDDRPGDAVRSREAAPGAPDVSARAPLSAPVLPRADVEPHPSDAESHAALPDAEPRATIPSSRVEPRGSTPRASNPAASWRPSARLDASERYGRFEILGRIGRGGMAEILLARERSLAGATRHLVVKRVLPEVAGEDHMLHMFLDEARVVMGLSHPNLCQIYEVGEQDGAWFIAMEWVNGVTLHQLVRRAFELGELDHGVIARIAAECAEALHHAHTARDAEGQPMHLVHRDVSPHNVMIAYDGRVKLLDFGIAKSIATTHQTDVGVVKGKICYMAPEQWLSQPLDGRTDVFALGACLHEALSGRVLFKRDSKVDVMHAALTGEVPLLTDIAEHVPEALAAIVHRALATRPADRFSTARALGEALERFLAGSGEPVGAARVADYARRLFRDELRLGPVLERAARGADLDPPSSPSIVPPPLPPASNRRSRAESRAAARERSGDEASPQADAGHPHHRTHPSQPRPSHASLSSDVYAAHDAASSHPRASKSLSSLLHAPHSTSMQPSPERQSRPSSPSHGSDAHPAAEAATSGAYPASTHRSPSAPRASAPSLPPGSRASAPSLPPGSRASAPSLPPGSRASTPSSPAAPPASARVRVPPPPPPGLQRASLIPPPPPPTSRRTRDGWALSRTYSQQGLGAGRSLRAALPLPPLPLSSRLLGAATLPAHAGLQAHPSAAAAAVIAVPSIPRAWSEDATIPVPHEPILTLEDAFAEAPTRRARWAPSDESAIGSLIARMGSRLRRLAFGALLAGSVPMLFAAHAAFTRVPTPVVKQLLLEDRQPAARAPSFAVLAAATVPRAPEAEPPRKFARASKHRRHHRAQGDAASLLPAPKLTTLLSIDARPGTRVYLGKKLLGTTPLVRVPVPRPPIALKLVERNGRVHVRHIAPTPGQRERGVKLAL